MKKRLQIWATLLVLLGLTAPELLAQTAAPTPLDLSSKEKIKKNLPTLLGSVNQGRDFWITFHPCHESSGFENEDRLYVTSDVATKVTVEIPGRQKIVNKMTIPDDIIEFSLPPNEAQCYQKDIPDIPMPQKVYPGYGIHVYADDPIVIYGVSRFYLTTDGFLGIPTSGYGTKYVVHSWEDYTSDQSGSSYYTSYLSVVGVYENTTVEVELGGAQTNYTPGPKSMELYDRRKEKLQPGDVWLIGVAGDYSDLTGSIIESDKPVSVLSGNFRTSLPGGASRDYLIEHMMPIHTWGRKYHVTPIIKRLNASMIRVYAGEENAVIYRDGDEWARIPGIGGEENYGWISRRAIAEDDPNDKDPVVISSNKRITVAQYNPTAGDDGVASDPFMMHLTPIAQYQTRIVFCTPGISDQPAFQDNYMNLCYKGTKEGQMPDDIEYGMPSNGTVNWVPFNTVVTNPGKAFKDDEITDGRHYKTVTFRLGDPAGVYALRSETPFAAYGYGFQSADSYGYPLSAALRNLEVPDIWTPSVEYVQDCSGYTEGTATEQPQVDSLRSNFADFRLMESESFNYELEWIDKKNFVQGETRYIDWTLTPEDPNSDARATIAMIDQAGNDTTFVIEFHATKFRITPKINLWPQIAYNDEAKPKTLTLKNLTENPVVVDSILLFSSNPEAGYPFNGFTVDPNIYKENNENGVLPGYEMQSGEELQFQVIFDPANVESQIKAGKDSFVDSVGVKAYYSEDEERYCYFQYLASVKASTGTPNILAPEHDFGPVTVNTDEPPSETFLIRNPGNSDLTITGVVGPAGEADGIYTHNWTDFPVTIPQGNEVPITVTFLPKAEIDYPDQIFFTSDADTAAGDSLYDPILELNGRGIAPSIAVNGYDWERRRVHWPAYDQPGHEYGNDMFPYPMGTHDDDNMMTIENGGTAEFKIIEAIVEPGAVNPEYFFMDYDNDGIFDGTLSDGIQSIVGQVFKPGGTRSYEIGYDPKSTGNHNISVTFIGEIESNTVSATADFYGTGITPEVGTSDYMFTVTAPAAPGVPAETAIVGDTDNPFYEVDVQVWNTASDEFADDLTVYDVRLWDTEGNAISTEIDTPGDLLFAFDKDAVSETGYPTVEPGNLYSFKARYYPNESSANRGQDPNIAHVEIITDAPNYDTTSVWSAKSITQGTALVGDGGTICVEYPLDIQPTIENTGDDEIQINNISLVPDNGLSQIVAPANFPVTLGPDDPPLTVDIVFYTTTTAGGDNATMVTFDTDILPTNANATNTPAVEITADPVSNLRNTWTLVDGDLYPSKDNAEEVSFAKNPRQGAVSDFTVSVVMEEGTNDMDYLTDADKSDITVEVLYNRNYLGPNYPGGEFDLDAVVELGDDLQDLGGMEIVSVEEEAISDITDSESVNTKITVELRTDQPLSVLPKSEIELIKVDFRMVLSQELLVLSDDDRYFQIDHKVTVEDACLTTPVRDRSWLYVAPECAENLVLIEDMATNETGGIINFDLEDINPNPVGAEGADINYSLGFECESLIQIIDASGDVVATPVTGRQAAGRFTAPVPVDKLSSGVYFIRIQAGPYSETKRLVIEK